VIRDILTGGSVLTLVGVLAKLAVDWLRGHRKDAADADVAEGSVAPTLVEKTLGAADAQIVFLEKANAAERASYERRLKALEADVKRVTHQRDELQTEVTRLRAAMDELGSQFRAIKQQLDALPHTP